MKLLDRIHSSPFLLATLLYLANNLVMRIPSYRIRHAFFRRLCRIKIGKRSSIHMGCFLTGCNIAIGDNTVINRQCYLDGRIQLTIGNNVSISVQTMILTLTHDPQSPTFGCLPKPVTIEDRAWIGARAMILPGVRIGEGAIVGAGAVVSKDVEPYTIVVGNPARVVKTRERNLTYQLGYFPYYDTDIQPGKARRAWRFHRV